MNDMEPTLLERAKKVVTPSIKKGTVSLQRLDLVLAYLKGEVTNVQVAKALGLKSGSAQSYLASTLLLAAKTKKIKIVKLK